ncbi:MAG: cbb3-type cytochrome c oxidase subunit I [Magnetococcales bacterium]|nr:cbb3-type cytochrome c oxidase subunit I [Magnetococcales bacterium]
MASSPFSLPVPEDPQGRRLAVAWLWLALCSLVGSGLVVILVVLARTPVLNTFLPWIDSFRTALVVHVDLSVLVWFLAFAGMLAALPRQVAPGWIDWLALWLAAAGCLLLTFSPFLAAGTPYRNNYVPVLDQLPFFAGLVTFLTGSGLMALRSLLPGFWRPTLNQGAIALRIGLRSALAILLLTLLVWLATWWRLEPQSEREYHFEVLFWGGGHVLQFAHSQIVMLVWLWLVSIVARPALTPRLAGLLFFLGALPVLAAPAIEFRLFLTSPSLRQAYVDLMWYGGGIALMPMGLAVVVAAISGRNREPRHAPLRWSLAFSLFLIALGGMIGFLIDGVNVTIPAHYHGVIVAITLAYMGLIYHLLPLLGYPAPNLKLATWQPILYGIGQSCHVLGLAWSGGHGVQRKTYGAEQALDTLSTKLAMGIMGLGGLLAVVAGVLFLVLVIRSLLSKPVVNS